MKLLVVGIENENMNPACGEKKAANVSQRKEIQFAIFLWYVNSPLPNKICLLQSLLVVLLFT